MLCCSWGKAPLRRVGGNGGSGLCSAWQWRPLDGNDFPAVKLMFSAVPCHPGGRLGTGSWTFSKGTPQSGTSGCICWRERPSSGLSWREELLNRFLGLGCSSSCSRMAVCGSPGCHSSSRLVEPCPGHLLSSTKGFWLACFSAGECFAVAVSLQRHISLFLWGALRWTSCSWLVQS